MGQIDKQGILMSRQFFYRLFAKTLYLEPTAKNLKEFFMDERIEALAQKSDASTAVEVEFFIALRSLADFTTGDWQVLLAEYRRLFLQPDHVVVCPWESVYLSRERVIFDEHTLAVQDFYQRFGMKAPHRSEGPADHIGIECSFMAYLSENALISNNEAMIAESVNAQQQFLQEHIGRFIEKFCTALVEQSSHNFYRSLANFLAAYVKADIKFLQEINNTVMCQEELSNEF